MNSNVKSSNLQTGQRTMLTESPTIGFSAARLASMFTNAQNTHITGSSFRITNNTVQGPFDALHRRVSPNAILNAGGRVDEVRCNPGTREEVVDRIEKWRDAQDTQTPPIFWLTGPAGAGKTAIVQTIAERCNTQQVPQANFFFFRTDSSRNTLFPLVATLVHQIVLLYPALRDPVATVLATNPLILDAILEDQLTQLIVVPLLAIQQSLSSYQSPLLLIDGLDECDSEEKRGQQKILHAFDQIFAKRTCPFRLLVASRDESQIHAAFNKISSQLLPLYLDEQYSPENDIRVFVTDKFNEVRKTHPLAYTLDATWPSDEDVMDIVRKSSGHFMYAATVMRFISDSVASPALSLAKVQGAAPASTKLVFSHLDAVYTYILSQVDDQETLKHILHAQLFIDRYTDFISQLELMDILSVYNPKYTEAMVHSCLAHLTPIAEYHTELSIMFFHHASISDYLLDQSRSSDYFVDMDAFNFKIQPAMWKVIEEGTNKNLWMKGFACRSLIQLRRLPPDLLKTLVKLEPLDFDTMTTGDSTEITIVDVLKQLSNLSDKDVNVFRGPQCTRDDDFINYKRILRRWISVRPLGKKIINGHTPDDSKWPPGSRRYLAMAYIERDPQAELRPWIDHALRSTTEFDVQEIALWLKDLLHDIHREIYFLSIEEYNQLLQTWISWATSNNIPLDGVRDLPNAWWYLQRSRVEKWAATLLRFGSRPE